MLQSSHPEVPTWREWLVTVTGHRKGPGSNHP